MSSLGTSRFPQQLWSWLSSTVEPASYYAVAIRYQRNQSSNTIDGVEVLFHAGDASRESAQMALELYVKDDSWRYDPILPYVEQAHDYQLVSTRQDRVIPTEYGQFFKQGPLGEDCTLLSVDQGYVYTFSIYRHRNQPSYTLAELSRMRQCCELLLPLLSQHSRLAPPGSMAADLSLAQYFEQRARREAIPLSAQERAVCAAVLNGRAIAEIAATLSIGQCSVRTYFDRALHKLGVENKAALFSWCLAGSTRPN